MLTPSQCERLEVVLVSPRNPLNIGAAARAMANFGFRRLSIVAPFAVNWMEAKSAVGAPELLREARVFHTLAEAVEHCTLVLGTGSLDRRKPVQTILKLPEAAPQIRRALAETPVNHSNSQDRSGVAILFGSEKHGLTAEDLSWCHGLIVIETSEAQPSINLGQAVAVCLYEISRNPTLEDPAQPGTDEVLLPKMGTSLRNDPYPDAGQLDRLAELIEQTMAQINYTTRGLRSANGAALRVLLRRLMPDEADLRRMMGLFRRILWQLLRSKTKV